MRLGTAIRPALRALVANTARLTTQPFPGGKLRRRQAGRRALRRAAAVRAHRVARHGVKARSANCHASRTPAPAVPRARMRRHQRWRRKGTAAPSAQRGNLAAASIGRAAACARVAAIPHRSSGGAAAPRVLLGTSRATLESRTADNAREGAGSLAQDRLSVWTTRSTTARLAGLRRT